jgi:O-antigen biosynthesis protein
MHRNPTRVSGYFHRLFASIAIRRSDFFDESFYRTCYREIADSHPNPLHHFLTEGWKQGRWPNPSFDLADFLIRNPALRPMRNFPVEAVLTEWQRIKAVRSLQPPAMDPLSTGTYRLPDLSIGLPELSDAECTRLFRHLLVYGIAPANAANRTAIANPAAMQQAIARIARLAALRNPTRQPEVSILVPVYEQERLTLSCIESILLWPHRRPFEIILADDASPSAFPLKLYGIPGIRVIRSERNLGYLRNCNHAAAHAAGKYIVLLNNDTVVLPQWMDALIDTLETVPSAGLAGSRLIFPDGRLQEAGGVIWEDGTGWNYGRYQNPDDPAFTYRRDADYCSGASIAIGTELWKRLGGYDPRYAPAYYEDTDLAFRVREQGLRVIYQPLSKAIHLEGQSSESHAGGTVKQHQAINHRVFLDRWKLTLHTHGGPDNPPSHFENRRTLGRLLFVDATTPTPDQDSGSADIFNIMKLSLDLGFEASFIPENLRYAGRYTRQLQGMGVQCWYRPHVTNLADAIVRALPATDAVILFRVDTAANAIDRIRDANPRIPVIFDTVDLHFLRLERQAELQGDSAIAARAAATREREIGVMRKADATIVLSRYEQDLVAKISPDTACHRIPIVRDIPGRAGVGFDGRNDIGFLGGFGHPPNLDAVRYFLSEIWPLVRNRLPDCRFLIAGSRMPEELTGGRWPGVEAVGFVQDLKPFFARCRLTVAPLRYGAGLKGKVVSSLAHGVPVVATGIAAEGSGLEDGREILVAEDPERFADYVVRAYSDRKLWTALSDRGLEFCESEHSFEAVRPALKALLQSVGLRLSA